MVSELTNYLSRVEDLRGQIRNLVAELPASALNWKPIEGKDDHATNSLAVLTAHVAGAEHYWMAEIIGGRIKTRDRDAEFVLVANNAEELASMLDKTAHETREVFSTLSESDLSGTRQVNDRIVPVRWAILHVIDHTALHLGHMQITYQLWAGGKSVPSPLWTERLPKNQ